MEDDGSSKEVLSQKKNTIDDIIDHITADLQSYDGKYILLGQPSDTDTQSIWQQRVTRQPESLNYVQNPYQEQQRINHRPLESNYFYSPSTYIDNSRSNYVPCMFNNSNQYQNPSNGDSHYNYVYYQHQANSSPSNSEYGLFNPPNFQNHHLIENLMGNWVPNQNGTYSPFGNAPHMLENRMEANMSMQHQTPPTQHASPSSTFSKLGNSAVRRPRMVAEVRPMRPSYSDVLAKSVTPPALNTANGTAKSVTASKVEVVRNKITKSKKGAGNSVTKNGGPMLKRQHSSGSEEQMLNGVRQASDKKTSPTNENHSWSSLEDLSKLSPYNEFEKESPSDRSPLSNLNNKKGSGRKAKSTRQTGENEIIAKGKYNQKMRKETDSENKKLHTNQTETRKAAKKSVSPSTSNNSNLQWGVGKQTSPVRSDKKNTKSNSCTDAKKSSANKNAGLNVENTVDSSKANASNKISARFNSVPINQRKLQRFTKRREGTSKIALVWKRWREKTSQYMMLFFTWFLYLLSDVLVMSFQLCVYLLGVIINCSGAWFNTVKALLKNVYTNPRNWWHQRKKGSKTSSSKKLPYSNRCENGQTNLTSNISLPQTGEEAMKRLFACKGKDPYSILGVTKTCPDEVIKKYYKRQAVLVHPDKNNQPGAEEAFKILVHAFDLIGEPERRKAYDRCVMESMEAEWEKLSDLLSQLHKKMEYAANTIRCTNCGQRHKRSMVERPLYAARFCSQCKIHHSAREGDIWAESSMLGWLWRYYACMDGAVYDISDWAACQADNLRHLKPNTHVVQYRIVVGKHRPNPPPASSPQPPPPSPPNCSEQDLEDFLSTLYGHGSGGQASGDHCNSRFRKKSKRKK